MDEDNAPKESYVQSNTIFPKGKYIVNLILIPARRSFLEGVWLNFVFLILTAVDVASYSLGKLPGGRWNCEQIRATSTTNRIVHDDSRSLESSWPSRYRRYRISRIRFNGHLVFKPEKKNCRRTNGRVDRWSNG